MSLANSNNKEQQGDDEPSSLSTSSNPLDAVRESCALISLQATKGHIDHEVIVQFAAEIHTERARYQALLASDEKPFHDPDDVWRNGMQWKPASFEEELSAHMLLCLLNIGHGFKQQLKANTLGRYKHGAYGSAYVTMMEGCGRMLLKLDGSKLDSKCMTNWTLQDTLHCFQLEAIPLLANQVTELITRAGGSLASHGFRSLGHLALSALENESPPVSASSLVATLIRCVPHGFADKAIHSSTGIEVHFYKKVQLCARDILQRWSKHMVETPETDPADSAANLRSNLQDFTVMSDNVLPAVLRAKGVVCLTDEASIRMIADGDPVPFGSDLEIELRALSVHACELIVEAANEITLKDDTALPVPSFTASMLDGIIWGVLGKDVKFRDAPRHYAPSTLFY